MVIQREWMDNYTTFSYNIDNYTIPILRANPIRHAQTKNYGILTFGPLLSYLTLFLLESSLECIPNCIYNIKKNKKTETNTKITYEMQGV